MIKHNHEEQPLQGSLIVQNRVNNISHPTVTSKVVFINTKNENWLIIDLRLNNIIDLQPPVLIVTEANFGRELDSSHPKVDDKKEGQERRAPSQAS